MKFEFLKKPWVPMLAGFLLAGSFVLTQPGAIVKDAGEYDALAQSIMYGSFEIDGKPSMLREPGYPLLRAAIRLVTDNPMVVLWFQVLLFVAIIWLVWDTLRRLDLRLAMIGAWSAGLSYGLAIYASRHLLEMFAAFLAVLVAWFAVRVMFAEKPWKDLIGFSIVSSLLILTRVPLALVPIALAVMLAWNWKKKGFVEVAKRGSLFVAILIVLVSPWVIRNGKTFGVWSIAGRTGIQVAARAYKANESWDRWRDSFSSVLIGRSLNGLTYPQSKPIILEQWKWVWDRFAAWGIDRNEVDADKALRKEAFGILLSDVPHFLRGGAWSIIDMGRLLALPSPLSPEFGIEGMFWPKVEAGTIGLMDRWVLVLAHFLQMAWWVGMLIGLYFGFQRFGSRFFPGFIVIAVVVAHIPADNIARYAAPIFPWLVFLVGFGWMQSLFLFTKPGDRAVYRKSPSAVVLAANEAYHRIEAGLYDQAHPEILWCERNHWLSYAKQWLQPSGFSRSILDIGAGTGFVCRTIKAYLSPSDHYIALDLSKEMLEILARELPSPAFHLDYRVAPAEQTGLPETSVDMIFISSAMHHFPDPEAVLREVARVLKPGGLFVVMHEPNIRFSRSAIMRQVARFSSVLASRIDPRGSASVSVDYAPVFAEVNKELMNRGFITEPLTPSEIQALVDVHSPTARGRFEAVGFDPASWSGHGPLSGWQRISFETYNFLGKLDPTARAWRRMIERTLSIVLPGQGSLFSIVLRKPKV